VDVFVSRLHPETHVNELVECVSAVKGDLSVQEVSCTKLNSRYEHLYSSYCVRIRVDSQQMKQAIATFMSAESWPVGVFVKRYFPSQNGIKKVRLMAVLLLAHSTVDQPNLQLMRLLNCAVSAK